MKPTLFVLAAGMGSRYGGLKQLDPLGPQGQTIMDYSIYDAIQSENKKCRFHYLCVNLKMIVWSYSSPGRSTTDGNCG